MGGTNGQTEVKPPLTGLTFIHTATQKDAKRLLTRDFNADPNVWLQLPGTLTGVQLQKQKNVTYVGDYQSGSPFEWTWTWTPIADSQSPGPSGHRSFCCVLPLNAIVY